MTGPAVETLEGLISIICYSLPFHVFVLNFIKATILFKSLLQMLILTAQLGFPTKITNQDKEAFCPKAKIVLKLFSKHVL